MKASSSVLPKLLALVYLAAHLPFLAPSLEDIDSINFALGLRHFDPALYQPHPPGYPVFILLGHVSLPVAHLLRSTNAVAAEAWALAIWSAIGGALCLIAAWYLFEAVDVRLKPDAPGDQRRIWAVVLLACAPLFWITGLRPMSDMPGLAAAIAAQALLLNGRGDRRRLLEGALLAGLGIGIRVQIAALTLPVLAWVVVERRDKASVHAFAAFVVACLAWAIPLAIATRGVSRYLAAIGSQGSSDFSGVDMLWLDPSPRHLAVALYQTFAMPWASMPLAVVVLAIAFVGVVVALVREWRVLVLMATAFTPYLVFHLLFHETVTVRYALPMLVPVAWLASRGLTPLRRFVPFVAVPVAAAALLIAVPDAIVYGGDAHPAFRAIADAVQHARVLPPGASFSHDAIARPLQAAETTGLHVAPPAALHYEWLDAENYWRAGGTAPVWFFADRRRTDLALIDPHSLTDVVRYRWRMEDRPEVSGTRPLGVDWYRLPVPGWFAGEGWSLTAETGGLTQATDAGPDHQPITAWVRRRPGPFHLVIGGRHLGNPGDPDANVVLSIDDRPIDRWRLTNADRNFLRFIELPDGIAGSGTFAELTVASESADPRRDAPIAIRQFDIQPAGQLLYGFGEGWHEAEFTIDEGPWRWTSERAIVRIEGPAQPVRLTIRGESPMRYFAQPPTVRITAGGSVIREYHPNADFNWDVAIPADALTRSGGAVAIETTPTYRPGGADERHLGLRILDLHVYPVSP